MNWIFFVIVSIVFATSCCDANGNLQTSNTKIIRSPRPSTSKTAVNAMLINSILIGADSKTVTPLSFLQSNWFFVAELMLLFISKTYPHVGKTGGILKPEFWINRVGVMFIFFINGLSLSTEQLKLAGSEWKLHTLIQTYNLGFLPLIGYFLSSLYQDTGIRDGLVCLAALPVTINICVTLTQAAGANVICSIFNAVIGNIIGVFWTPLLTFMMLNTNQEVSLSQALQKLSKIVLIPLFIGQVVRVTKVGKLLLGQRKYTKVLGEIILLGVVLNTFSDTFLTGFSLSSQHLTILTISLAISYLLSNLIFWKTSEVLLPHLSATTRAAATICSSQKTLAFGIPFIKTAFGHKSNVANILTPLLIYSPIQLFLGSLVVVQFAKKRIEQEEKAKA